MKVTIETDDRIDIKVQKLIEENDFVYYSMYARVFDDACTGWTHDRAFNRLFLLSQQTYANDLLRHKGYLFLNDVYDMLGIPKTKAGQVVGWIYNTENPTGDNFVDFDIDNENNSVMDNNNFIIDFNVDGLIIDKI